MSGRSIPPLGSFAFMSTDILMLKQVFLPAKNLV